MNIKGKTYTFKELTSAGTAASFQEQINRIQENIENCKKEINNFDVYRITYAISDLLDISAIKNKLLPGEAAVITAPTQGDWHTGQLILRLNNLEYTTLEPFQTGTYFPSCLETILNSEDDANNIGKNYILYYSFTETSPIDVATAQEISTDPDDQLTEAYKNIKATIEETNSGYYYSFSSDDDTNPSFMLELADYPDGITFNAMRTRPILKFFITKSTGYEEVLLKYSLSKTNNVYTLTVDDYPEGCLVAIK